VPIRREKQLLMLPTAQRTDLWKEHPILTGITAVAVIIIVAYIAVVVGFWCGNLPPRRPSAVAPEAVWALGPGRKYGHWILCSVTEAGPNARCKLWDESGGLDFEGDFRAARRSVLYPTARLDIDARITGPMTVRIRNTLVPIIYLKSRQILVPIETHARQLSI